MSTLQDQEILKKTGVTPLEVLRFDSFLSP